MLDLDILEQFIAPVASAVVGAPEVALAAPATPVPLQRVSQFTSPEGPSATASVLRWMAGGR